MRILKSKLCYLILLLLFVIGINAQAGTQVAPRPNIIMSFFPVLLLLLIIYFIIMKPILNKRKDSLEKQ